MRRLIGVLVIVSLLLVLTSSVVAEPKPTTVPHQVIPGEAGWPAAWGAIDSMWVDMSDAGELGGALDSDSTRGPIPIGFTFHYMDGPVEPAAGWPPADWKDWWPGPDAPPLPEDWPAELTDAGYDHVYIAQNGYVVLADPDHLDPAAGQDPNMSGDHYYDPALGPQRPNNYIAPLWGDWDITDNTTWKVAKVCYKRVPCPSPSVEDTLVSAQVCWGWVPCEWEEVERPRGRLLTKTMGAAPNRVFVVEWQNARQYYSGNLMSFQLQMFEGSNAILFQYKDPFPAEDGRPLVTGSLVIGMEDASGKTFLGQWFGAVQNKPSLNWTPGSMPVSDGDQIGFVY